MIHVLATIQVSPGKRDELAALIRKLIPKVLEEDGCIEYTATIDTATDIGNQSTNNDEITFVEKWESIAHLKAHFTAPHMLEHREASKGLVAGSVLKVLEDI